MRPATAALVAIVMLTMLITDGIACADGCTEPGHAASLAGGQTAGKGDTDHCVLCSGTLPVPEPTHRLPPDLVARSHYSVPPDTRASAPAPRIDHPPRTR
jgi:hypothetical protein